jgi:hypothetical protein
VLASFHGDVWASPILPAASSPDVVLAQWTCCTVLV